MAWTPKGTAPASFRLRDAFLALITGDPTWGWLVDWLPYVGGDSWVTADFCAEGPPEIPVLDPGLFIGPANRNPLIAAAQQVAKVALLGLLAKDRVFGAFCENIIPLSGGYGPTHCWDSAVVGGWSGGGYKHTGIFVPPGATIMNFVSLTLYGTNYGGNLFYVETTGDGGTTRQYLETGSVNDALGWTTSKQWTVVAGRELIMDSNAGWTGIFCVRFNAGETQDHEPEPQPAPDDYVTGPTVEPDLPGIAHELEMHERKLDFLISLVQFGLRIDPYIPDGGAEDPEELDADEVKLVGDYIGVIVEASGIPAPLDVGFGDPQQIARLGRVNLGTEDAWYPSIPLTHSPMVIRPFPPGTTQVNVTGLPPGVSVTLAFIRPSK